MQVFVSYSHKQGDWTLERLVPCLEAGGAEVLIDRKRFQVGKAVVGQMDAAQDQADRHVLVLSPEYLNSPYCKHEMNRATKRDPKFTSGIVLPVLREACTLPKCFSGWNPPLYANLADDSRPEPWSALLDQCGASGLGSTAPMWLSARDDIVTLLSRRESVNLVVHGEVNWRGLLKHVVRDHLTDLALVDLEDPDTSSRHGLLATISRALGNRTALAKEPYDLADFKSSLNGLPVARVAITHFDLVAHKPYYDADLFAAIRFLISESRKLVLMAQSRTPFATLLPRDHPLSHIDMKTVELRSGQ